MPSIAARGSVVGRPSASSAHPCGIGSPRCRARYTLPRATAVLAMSRIMGACLPAGAAMDHGLLPILFARPPHGAIDGLALVERKPMQPALAASRVQYIAVPKWLELRTATAPRPCRFARAIA